MVTAAPGVLGGVRLQEELAPLWNMAEAHLGCSAVLGLPADDGLSWGEPTRALLGAGRHGKCGQARELHLFILAKRRLSGD